MFSAQLKDESEKWTAYKFSDGGESAVPQIMPFAPLRVELDNWTMEAITVNVVQAGDLGFHSNSGGIYAFMDALFSQKTPDSYAPGVIAKVFKVPAFGSLREVLNPSLPWLAIWPESAGEGLSEAGYSLRVETLGTIERGPSRLALEAAPTYGEREYA